MPENRQVISLFTIYVCFITHLMVLSTKTLGSWSKDDISATQADSSLVIVSAKHYGERTGGSQDTHKNFAFLWSGIDSQASQHVYAPGSKWTICHLKKERVLVNSYTSSKKNILNDHRPTFEKIVLMLLTVPIMITAVNICWKPTMCQEPNMWSKR